MIESGNPIGPVPQDELDYLVSRLRDDSPAHQPSDKRSAADAIVALREENESLRADCGIRQIAGYNKGRTEAKSELDELRMKLGIAEGFINEAFNQRDALQSLRALDLAAMVELGRERDAARAECEKLRALLREAQDYMNPNYVREQKLSDTIDAALGEGK